MACGDLDTALQIWEDLLSISEQLPGQSYVLNRRWIATCFYHKCKLAEARQLFQASLQDAERIGDRRSIIGNKIRLAAIDLEEGDLEEAAKTLAECNEQAHLHQDRRRLSEIQPLAARLHILRGDIPAARAALMEAIDLFERLGMRRKLAEAREALANLETRKQSEAAG
jgi:tetratricopeptide (TPR) repeat protein